MHDDNARQLGKKELRDFGLTTASIIVILFGLLLPWLFSRAFPLWPWIVSGVLGSWALLFPTSLKFIYRGWMAIGLVLGWINTRIILGIMFFLLFVPTGLLMKLLRKDPMTRQIDKARKSYRVTLARRNKNHVERPY